MTYRLPEIFSKNRNEESQEDNWSDFVVPYFINDLEIKSQSKAIVIMGGRGCGKTTLLRYFCHATQFSPRRSHLPENACNHIGLYWRADTNFLNSFIGGEQTPETWRAAFEHMLACEFGKEIIRSLRNLNCNPERQKRFGFLEKVNLAELKAFDESLGDSPLELEKSLQRSRTKLSMWVNNLDTYSKPTFLPADEFLRALITVLKQQLPYLNNSNFAIFIDEYENLRDEQQSFINGLLKHGAPPLLYNIAMKRNGWHTQQTIGSESIQEISDYRVIDLEEYLTDNFDLFAAELLFFRLAEHEPELCDKLPIVPDQLRSIDDIEKRYSNPEYRDFVIGSAEKMLPRISPQEASIQIIQDTKLREKLISKIKDALKKRGSNLSADRFIDNNFPESSVIMSALINREREDLNRLVTEFTELKDGAKGRLSPSGDLISNYLFGCVNSIYLDARRNSILFSGFTAHTLIAKGNIRYLLELIHRIFKIYGDTDAGNLPVVPPEIQARAVRDASESILSTVSGHGKYGPQLHALTLCLGSIFRERHRRDTQSEPEINHFTLSGGDIDEKLQNYLYEAEKWSVLFLSKETKMKSTGAISNDYILNPIFAPFFQISFRKKRSLPITSIQLMQMLEGDQSARDKLVRELGRQESKSVEQSDIFGE
ncbi:hypothetical protein A1353_00200 [Methylomonas methanica]|uniref:Uncharacterized protein n=1 Tax=Methylomonas methanica TaxID=421 RepID=A0A177MIM0_METMH|nr:hypothetical protein [Methylomonas methanica]OAI05294.1 hypothetical protein A1353_00200 [Methylomonas methanica]